MFDDDFDPDFHTEEERIAHHWARYEADAEYRHKIDATAEGLERLQQVDPVGLAMFGEPYVMDDDGRPPFVNPDEWIDKRLDGETPK